MTDKTKRQSWPFDRLVIRHYGLVIVCCCTAAAMGILLAHARTASLVNLGLMVITLAFYFAGYATHLEWRARQLNFWELVTWTGEVRDYAVGALTDLEKTVGTIANKGNIAPPALAPSFSGESDDRPLGTRERNNLLVVIAILCKEAEIDYMRSAKAAVTIKDLAASRGLSIGETTIETMMKRIPDALEARLIK